MLKIIGICILLFAVFVAFAYMRQLEKRRLLLSEELSSFLHFTRRMVGCYLKPTAEIARLFKTDEPELKELKEQIVACGSVGAALHSSGILEKITPRLRQILLDCFEGFGSGYLGDEISRLDYAVNEFDLVLRGERESAPDKLKLSSTLCVALSLGVLILFI